MSKTMIRPMSPFLVATVAPIPLLFLGSIFGGIFILAAFLYMTVFTMVLDSLVHTAGPEAAPGVEWPMAEKLSLGLAAAHFPMLLVGIAAVTGITGLGFLEGLIALLAFGMFFGQVSNSNAHELIHKTDKMSFNAGKWVLISLLFGHHVTAHLKIHHRYVGTPQDPNTAALGESFWAFFTRAWGDSFAAGWEIENSMAEVSGKQLPIWKHPYFEYIGGAVAIMFVVLVLLGFTGLMGFLLIAIYAQMQLLLSDYVQHYGLRRRKTGDDTYEDVAPWHSWNAPHWFSSGLMLNATRHSDHHVNPGRAFPQLALPAEVEGPRMPYSLPVMAAIAMVPSKWERLMNHRVMEWQERIDNGAILRSRAPDPVASPELGMVQRVSAADTDAVADRVNAALSNGSDPTSELKPGAQKPRKPGLRRARSVARELESSGRSRRRDRDDAESFKFGVGAKPEAAQASEAQPLMANDKPAEATAEESSVAYMMQSEKTASEQLTSRSSDLWNVMDDDDDGPVANGVAHANGLDQPVEEENDQARAEEPEHAEVKEPDVDALTSAIRAASAEIEDTSSDKAEAEDIDLSAIEDTHAEVEIAAPKSERRTSRDILPALEPADEPEEPDEPEEIQVSHPKNDRVVASPRKVIRGAGLAARGFAAVMRGAPSGRPGHRPAPER